MPAFAEALFQGIVHSLLTPTLIWPANIADEFRSCGALRFHYHDRVRSAPHHRFFGLTILPRRAFVHVWQAKTISSFSFWDRSLATRSLARVACSIVGCFSTAPAAVYKSSKQGIGIKNKLSKKITEMQVADLKTTLFKADILSIDYLQAACLRSTTWYWRKFLEMWSILEALNGLTCK